MNERFRKTLVLALRSDTGENEAAAAFSALRRMALNGSVSELLSEKPEPKVVYRDKVIYKDRIVYASNYTHTLTYTITVPATFLHSYIDKVFISAANSGLILNLISFKSSNGKVLSPTEIKFKVLGNESEIYSFSNYLDKIKHKIISKSSNTHSPSDRTDSSSQKKTGVFKRAFNAIFN